MNINPQNIADKFKEFNQTPVDTKSYISFKGREIAIVKNKNNSANLESISSFIEKLMNNDDFKKLNSQQINEIKKGLKTVKDSIVKNQGFITRIFGQSILQKADKQISTLEELEQSKKINELKTTHSVLENKEKARAYLKANPNKSYILYQTTKNDVQLLINLPAKIMIGESYTLDLTSQKSLEGQIKEKTENESLFKLISSSFISSSYTAEDKEAARKELNQPHVPIGTCLVYKENDTYKILYKLQENQLGEKPLEQGQNILEALLPLIGKEGPIEILKSAGRFIERSNTDVFNEAPEEVNSIKPGDYLITRSTTFEKSGTYELFIKQPNGDTYSENIGPIENLLQNVHSRLANQTAQRAFLKEEQYKGFQTDERTALGSLFKSPIGHYCLCPNPKDQDQMQFIRKLSNGEYHMESIPKNENLFEVIHRLINKKSNEIDSRNLITFFQGDRETQKEPLAKARLSGHYILSDLNSDKSNVPYLMYIQPLPNGESYGEPIDVKGKKPLADVIATLTSRTGQLKILKNKSYIVNRPTNETDLHALIAEKSLGNYMLWEDPQVPGQFKFYQKTSDKPPFSSVDNAKTIKSDEDIMKKMAEFTQLDSQITDYMKISSKPENIVRNLASRTALDTFMTKAPIGETVLGKTTENPPKYYFAQRISTFQTLVQEIKPGDNLLKKIQQYSSPKGFFAELSKMNQRELESHLQEGPIGGYIFFINKEGQVHFKQKILGGARLQQIPEANFFQTTKELTSEQAQREVLQEYFVADLPTAQQSFADKQDKVGSFRLFDTPDHQSVRMALKSPRNEVVVLLLSNSELLLSVGEHLSPEGAFNSLASHHAKDREDARKQLKNPRDYRIWKEEGKPEIQFMQKMADGRNIEKEIPAAQLYEQIEQFKDEVGPRVTEGYFQ